MKEGDVALLISIPEDDGYLRKYFQIGKQYIINKDGCNNGSVRVCGSDGTFWYFYERCFQLVLPSSDTKGWEIP